MSMVEKEKDLIGFAHKVISFRMNVIKACKAKGIGVPTDEQISDYINDYGLHFEDFMADFIEHEGMFRYLKTPLEEFNDEINAISWGKKPTKEEILSFFSKNGNNISLFCRQHTIKDMKPLERKVYLKTIETLPIEGLVALWNLFIEESAIYGEDSHIYDLENAKDVKFLAEHMPYEEQQVHQFVMNLIDKKVRYVQWSGMNDNSIQGRTDDKIISIITAYWSEIFERVIAYPYLYVEVGNVFNYFAEVIWPIILKEAGIEISTDTNEVKYIEKKS